MTNKTDSKQDLKQQIQDNKLKIKQKAKRIEAAMKSNSAKKR